MKYLGKQFVLIIPLFILFYGVFGPTKSHGGENENKIAMLNEFYIAYNTAWGSDSNFGIIVHQLDSMRQKYCSKKFILELNKEVESHGYDHDIVTGDLAADEKYLQDISIVKDSSMKNWYIVSYIGIIIDNSNPVKIEVKLQVEVINEDGSYKINDVRPIL